MMLPGRPSGDGRRIEDIQAVEVRSIEAAVTGNEPVSVRLSVRADKKVRYNALLVPPRRL